MAFRRTREAVYRCPKGGYHKFGRRKFMDVFLGFSLGSRTTVGTRKCRKCKKIFGAGGEIRQG